MVLVQVKLFTIFTTTLFHDMIMIFYIKPRTIEYKDSEIKSYVTKIKDTISKYEGMLNG